MNKATATEREPGSFRDPSGFLFRRQGQLFRQVNSVYRENYDQLLDSGLYESLVSSGLLIPHQEVSMEAPEPDRAYKVILPEQLPLISYPYEWSFSQLKHAALTTLELQKKALEYGMSLKDGSAYNIQFREGKPVLIDTLSFEAYREGEPWVAYRQFCQHFLAPLALMGHKDVRLNQLLRVHLDGVPLDLASALLPFRSRLNFGLLSHVHLHAQSQRRHAGKPVDAKGREMSRMAFLGLVDSLERTVNGLGWQPKGTEWIDYEDGSNYSAVSFEHKAQLVSEFLDLAAANRVWDLGANTGFYSRIAAGKGIQVLSADIDPACVEANYLRCIEEGETRILPLFVDLTNPSPGIGWQNEEHRSLIERGPVDAVLALALIHHLAISNNLPFDRIASLLASICHWLIIEFVPKRDAQVQRLLQTREDIFTEYSQESFERTFERSFSIRKSVEIQDSQRVIYLMEQKSS